MERKRFFEPWIPEKYNEGINGKKILVFGASYYCKEVNCPYYKDCTSVEKKDSSLYDKCCPSYIASNRCLHDEPSYTTGEARAYSNFARLFSPYVKEGENIWDYLAFTNYVQFFLPCSKDDSGKVSSAPTLPEHLSPRDFDAFIEVIQEQKPDVVVIWGAVIAKPIRDRQNNQFIYDLDECFDNTEGYICHMNIPNVDHDIALFSCYHPSSRSWNESFEDAARYLDVLLKR